MKVLGLVPWGLTSDTAATTNSEKSADVIVCIEAEGLNNINCSIWRTIVMIWWNTRIGATNSQGSNNRRIKLKQINSTVQEKIEPPVTEQYAGYVVWEGLQINPYSIWK